MVEIKGKWALITGASRGLGYEIAKFMAQEGCNLIVHSRSVSHQDKLVVDLSACGVEIIGVEADLADEVAVKAMLDQIDGMGMRVDFVFNNAGMQAAYQVDYLATPMEDFLTSLQINVMAPMMICYHFLPIMQENGFGRIINTTSGITGEPQQAAYSASKAALDKVTRDLGTTLEGSDVIISLSDPGWCRTDMGGSSAPNEPSSTIPGLVLGAFVEDGISGRLFSAQSYAGMTLSEALDTL